MDRTAEWELGKHVSIHPRQYSGLESLPEACCPLDSPLLVLLGRRFFLGLSTNVQFRPWLAQSEQLEIQHDFLLADGIHTEELPAKRISYELQGPAWVEEMPGLIAQLLLETAPRPSALWNRATRHKNTTVESLTSILHATCLARQKSPIPNQKPTRHPTANCKTHKACTFDFCKNVDPAEQEGLIPIH